MSTQAKSGNQQLLEVLFKGGSKLDLYKLFQYKLYIGKAADSMVKEDESLDYNKTILKQRRPVKLEVVGIEEGQLVLQSESVLTTDIIKAEHEHFDEAVIVVSFGAGTIVKKFACQPEKVEETKSVLFTFKITI